MTTRLACMRHAWKVVEKVEQPSAYEQVKAAGTPTLKLSGDGIFVKPVIVHYRCANCPAEKVERI